MIDLTPSQKKTVAAGVTVVAFSFIVAFILALGWVLVKFLSFASSAITPVIVGLFLSLLLLDMIRDLLLPLFLLRTSTLPISPVVRGV